MKCANCDTAALYVYDAPGVSAHAYCASCLPAFLAPQAKAGTLTKTAAYAETQAQVVERLAPAKPKKAAKEAPVVEEPVVEDVPVEVVDETAPEAPAEDAVEA